MIRAQQKHDSTPGWACGFYRAAKDVLHVSESWTETKDFLNHLLAAKDSIQIYPNMRIIW